MLESIAVKKLRGGGVLLAARWSLAVPAVPDAAEAPVIVDAAKLGEPIAPFVYGQFIEHLGRCIYGGLWAEMLEDRKFYYPVDGRGAGLGDVTPGKRPRGRARGIPTSCSCARPG